MLERCFLVCVYCVVLYLTFCRTACPSTCYNTFFYQSHPCLTITDFFLTDLCYCSLFLFLYSTDISLSSVSGSNDVLPSAPGPMASASTAFSSSQSSKSDDGLVLHPATASSSLSKAQESSIPIPSLSNPTADLTSSVTGGSADLSQNAEDNSNGMTVTRLAICLPNTMNDFKVCFCSLLFRAV